MALRNAFLKVCAAVLRPDKASCKPKRLPSSAQRERGAGAGAQLQDVRHRAFQGGLQPHDARMAARGRGELRRGGG